MKHRQIAKRFWTQEIGLALDVTALARYHDIIDLSVGDTDLTTDQKIINAAFRDAAAGYTHYGDPKGDPELVAEICKAWQEDFGQSISGEQVLVTTSSCFAMAQVLMAILNPEDEVLIFSPYFSPYAQQIELAGGRAVEVPTCMEDGYQIHREDIEAAITPRTRAIIFNNPNNPTGVFYDLETQKMLASVTKEHDLILIADEIYTDYVFDGTFVPMRTLEGMEDYTITLNSFSKNYLMTGWRIGYLVAQPHIIQTVHTINCCMVYSAPSVSQRGALQALKMRGEIRQTYLPVYRERLQYAAERLEKLPYIDVVRPQGTFYIFPSIKRTGLTTAEFCKLLLEQAHIMVSPGELFGTTGAGHFRIACTVDKTVLKDAFDRMEKLKF